MKGDRHFCLLQALPWLRIYLKYLLALNSVQGIRRAVILAERHFDKWLRERDQLYCLKEWNFFPEKQLGNEWKEGSVLTPLIYFHEKGWNPQGLTRLWYFKRKRFKLPDWALSHIAYFGTLTSMVSWKGFRLSFIDISECIAGGFGQIM